MRLAASLHSEDLIKNINDIDDHNHYHCGSQTRKPAKDLADPCFRCNGPKREVLKDWQGEGIYPL